MKKTIKTAFLTAFALLGVACVQEELISGGEQGVPVEIRIDTRAPGDDGTHPGSADDRKVASLRVLIYDRHGVLKWNFAPLDVANLATGAAGAEQVNELSILTGTYDFVFVANEGSDPVRTAALAVLAPGSPMTSLRAMSFDEAAFDAGKNIPMVSLYPSVTVGKTNDTDEFGHVTYTDPFTEAVVTAASDFNVLLERAGIRLRLAITLTESQYAAWSDKKIWIDSIPAGAFLLPGIANSVAPWEEDRPYAAAVAAGAPGTITGPADGKYTVIYERIILPEVLFSPVGDPGKALELSMTLDDKPKKGKIWVGTNYDDGWGYTLPRNTFLDMTASIKDDGIVFSGITVIDWGRKSYNLTDRGIVLPKTGIPAAPGVLGVNARTGELTLVGSVHYKGTAVATDKRGPGDNDDATLEFGPISSDTVYVAYFKWGSLIATGGGENGDPFEADDVIWAPRKYPVHTLLENIAAANTADSKWAQVPWADDDTWPATAAPAAGIGDPCTLAELGKGTATARYIMPSGNPWGKNFNDPFGTTDYSGSNPFWVGAGVIGSKIPAGIVKDKNTAADWSMFLPYAGYRDLTNGAFGMDGVYWSSGPHVSGAYNLGFHDTYMDPLDDSGTTHAFAIRCVIPAPTLPTGVHAAPGVIGYIAEGKRMGELTLRGSSAFKGTPVETYSAFGALEEVPVWIAHFKFGSLVPVGGSNHNMIAEPFNAGDIIPVPSYDWLEDLKTDIGSQTGAEAWEYVPVSEPLEAEERIVSTPASWAEGLGDPCAYYFNGKYGGNWRTPTGNPWYGDRLGGAPFGTASVYWWNSTPHPFGAKWISNGLPEYAAFPNHGGVAGNGSGGQDWSMYLPITGNRNRSGQYLYQSNSYGMYLTSTAYDGQSPHLLLTSSGNVRPTGSVGSAHYYTEAFAVRCVPPPPPPALSATISGGGLTKTTWYNAAIPVELSVRSTVAWYPRVRIDNGTTLSKEASAAYFSVSDGFGDQTIEFTPPAVSKATSYTITFYSTDDPTGLHTNTAAKQIVVSQNWGGENHLLYYDAADQNRLKVARWGDPELTLDNMLYFTFGGVVGMTYDTWNGVVVYNPTELSISGTGDLGGPIAPRYALGVGGNTSLNAYHNLANVQAGLGDPCRLVGMTPNDIKGMTIDAELYALEATLKSEGTGGWRMPTQVENDRFVYPLGSKTWAYEDLPSGPPDNYWFMVPNSNLSSRIEGLSIALPASGYVRSNGVYIDECARDHYGIFWSSTADASGTGSAIRYYGGGVLSTAHKPSGGNHNGTAVRCVKPQ